MVKESSTSTTDTARLFRCAEGCNFDCCNECIDGVTVKELNRSMPFSTTQSVEHGA